MRNWKNLRYEKPEALFMPPLSLRNVKKQQQQQQKKWTVNTFFFSVFLVPLLNIISKKTLHVQHTFFLISKKTTLHVQHTFFLISKKTTLHVQHTFFLISKKTTLHVQHTFLYISLPLFCTTETSFYFLFTRFMKEMFVFVFTLFFHCRSFSLW